MAVPVTTRPYSVLLLYPLSFTSETIETHWSWVEAPTPTEAIALAREKCRGSLDLDPDDDPEDFRLLLIVEGHHADLRFGIERLAYAEPTEEEKPFDHASTENGCHEDCEACAWELEHGKAEDDAV